ncbi:MAG: hypothetical protein ING70_06350 [Rhodocyclaceae bacterium]|jgi:hypothetical protein|nr:hypothetical protein [Rhodocyclaceae bacterium]MCA3145265.1 hypothetical protein [Rhodocyclaceae bacterium]
MWCFLIRRWPLLAALLAVPAAPAAHAFVLADGREVFCEVERGGQPYRVPEEYIGNGKVGERHPELGGSAAVVRRQPDGRPKIVIDAVVTEGMRAKLPLARDFMFFHECAHIRRDTRDEVEANCEALAEMRRRGLVDAAGEAALGAFHERMGRLPLKYGGSGKVFWADTLACSESPGGLPDSPSAFPGLGGLFDPPYAP